MGLDGFRAVFKRVQSAFELFRRALEGCRVD